MTPEFDEDRFVALLDLAGQDTAAELTLRLDEDLTRVRRALDDAMMRRDQSALHEQSHILLAISGTIGATRVFELAKRLNSLVRGAEPVNLTDLPAEIMSEIGAALSNVLQRVRFARAELHKSP